MKMYKRIGPAAVPPVVINGIRFEAIHNGRTLGVEQNGGYIVAFDDVSNEKLWLLKVYDVKYNQKKETDVQDVFIVSLGNSGGKLRVVNEHDKRYLVDLASKKIERIK